MTYRVEISTIQEQFSRAHVAMIVDEMGGTEQLTRTSIRTHQSHWKMMEHGWQKQYNIKPVMENGHWKYLDFENEQQYTLFVLKWS